MSIFEKKTKAKIAYLVIFSILVFYCIHYKKVILL